MSGGGSLAVLLVAGHLVADFLVQGSEVATRKNEFSKLLRHGLESFVVHMVILWPFWSRPVFVGVVAVVVLHLVIDSWKTRARRCIANFLLDQGLHVLVLAGCWVLLVREFPAAATARTPADFPLGWYAWGILSAGLTAFNLRGGSSLVRLVLESTHVSQPSAGGGAGRGEMIGYLERVLVMASVLAGQWGLIGLVMAAKSIARFKELDEKEFAEYYLLGTLMSILVAVATGSAVLWAWGICK